MSRVQTPKLAVPFRMHGGGAIRRNLLKTPSFEYGTTNWTLVAAGGSWPESKFIRVGTAMPGKDGTWTGWVTLKKDATGTVREANLVTSTDNGAIEELLPYSLQGLFYVPIDNLSLGVTCYLNWYHDGETVELVEGVSPTLTGIDASEAHRLTIDGVIAPAGSNRCELVVKFESNVSGDTCDVRLDNFMLEQAESAGDFAPTVGQLADGRARWLGAEGSSASEIVPAPGRFAVVEQGSVDEVAGCAYALLATQRGSRLEEPDYGVEDPTFATLPLDTHEWDEQLRRWEPRAAARTTQEIEDLTASIVEEVGVQ